MDKGNYKTNRIRNLDNIPFPSRDVVATPFSDTLFPGERYGKGDLAATTIGSRGCPFMCAFCGNVYRAPVIYRSCENIIGELRQLINSGVTHFRFEDDNFTLHPEFPRLCLEIERLNIFYKCHTRSNLLTLEIADILKLSGCEECGIGVESADDRVLEIVHKQETTKQHGHAVEILRKAGIRSKTYFISGLPGETDETLKLNMEFMQTYKPEKWTISTFSPYPGCDVYNNPSKYNIRIIRKDWSRWGNFCKDSYNHIIEGQSPDEMWNRYKKMYAYFRSDEWRQ